MGEKQKETRKSTLKNFQSSMASAQAQVCPVVGTTTTVLPPHHPAYNTSDPEARCPVTNAKVAHHDKEIIHNHPTDPSIPAEDQKAMDASECPALKGANSKDAVTDATCPVVGPVSAYLPPTHPTLEDHKQKVHTHPAVAKDAPIGQCPVAKNMLN